MAVEIIEEESDIIFIKKSIERKNLYREAEFSTNLETARAYNEVSGEEYARLSRLMSGWPRFPDNFHSLFVAKAGSCDKYRAINRNRIDSVALTIDMYEFEQGMLK